MSSSSLTVHHDKENCEFFIEIDGVCSSKAVLQYVWIKKDVIDMHHTEVPPQFRGQGVAKLLAKDAMDFVVKENLKCQLSCTYLQKYVRDNPRPEYLDRLLHKL